MSHRFFSSIAGTSIIRISAITALALGLACGGGNRKTTPDDPDVVTSPSTPIVKGPNGNPGADNGINLHMYTITATSERAVDWDVPELPFDSISTIYKTPGTDAKVGTWQYTPRLRNGSGEEVITFRSRGYGGPQSEPPGYLRMNITENHGPQMPERLIDGGRIFVSRNRPANIAYLQFTDKDGDAINWQTVRGTFRDNGGRVEIRAADGLVTFDATGVPDGPYTAEFSYEERDPRTQTIIVPPTAGNFINMNVIVGDYSSGMDPNMGSVTKTPNVTFTPPTTIDDRTLVFGIPKVFTFRATDIANPGNEAISWNIAFDPGQSWITSKLSDTIPKTIGTGNDSVNIESSTNNRKHPDYDDYFKTNRLAPGQGIFVATGTNPPDGSPSTSILQATAKFTSTGATPVVVSSSSIPIIVNNNKAPYITDTKISGVTTRLLNAPPQLSVPFEANDGTDPILVFKGKTQNGTPSYGIESVIDFEVTISDDNLPYGDLLEWETPTGYVTTPTLRDVYATNSWQSDPTQYSVLSQLPSCKSSVDVSVDATTVKLTGKITLTMPEEVRYYGGQSVTDQGLSFVYKARDLGGNEIIVPIHVKTYENKAPVFDNYAPVGWPGYNSGDDEQSVGWADQRPNENRTTTWRIEWGSNDGKDLEDYKIADPDGNTTDSIYMAIASATTANPASNFTSSVSPSSQYRNVGNNFSFAWSPSSGVVGSQYTIKVNAFDKYGYAAYPLELKGVVYRSITGQSVKKSIYRAGKADLNSDREAWTGHVDTSEANFNTWGSIQLNSFYDSTRLNGADKARVNGYMSDFPDDNGRRGSALLSLNDTSRWTLSNVPPGPYLISADRLKRSSTGGSASDTTAPVVGPAVTSTNMINFGGVTPNDVFDTTNTANDKFTGGNRYTYAYIENSSPNLSTHAGSGALAWKNDKSLREGNYDFQFTLKENPGTPPPKYVDDDAQLDEITSSTSYKGSMVNIGRNMTPNKDAIQFTFPSIAQSGFFDTATTLSPGGYPADSYVPMLGWTGTLGKTTVAPNQDGANYDPITMELKGIIPYRVSNADNIQLSTMRQEMVKGKINALDLVKTYPYWKMSNHGIASAGNEIDTKGASTVTQITNFTSTPSSGLFNAVVNRGSFRAGLERQVTWDPDDLGNLYDQVTDTLQVKAYVNGTSLGPDSHAGLPTLLEFGNFNADPGGEGSGNAFDLLSKFDGIIDLGRIEIPAPTSTDAAVLYWNAGGTRTSPPTPVASYIATFPSPYGLPGSMGLIAATTDPLISGGISRQVSPVTNVKITGATTYDATTDLANSKAPNHAAAGIPVSNHIEGGVLTMPTAPPVEAKAYLESSPAIGSGVPKVWLSWTNPSSSENISGNILEFFIVSDNVSLINLSEDTVPNYVVHVAPQLNEFPIPNTWTTNLGETGKNVIVRIRTVRYGPNNSSRIDFNVSPFLKALPYAWAETITELIKFPIVTYP